MLTIGGEGSKVFSFFRTFLAFLAGIISDAWVQCLANTVYLFAKKVEGFSKFCTHAYSGIMVKNIEVKSVLISEQYQVISEFMLELHKHEHTLFDKTADWKDIEHNYMRHAITMQEEHEGVCLVAYVDGVPAGFIFGYTEDQDDSRIEIYEGKELYVSDGYVAKAYRRQGVYHTLNKQLEDAYIQKGVNRITRFTHINNIRMRQLLESEGYVVTRLLYEKWV